MGRITAPAALLFGDFRLPIHHAAQIFAHDFELLLGFHSALGVEVRAVSLVFENEVARERAVLNICEHALHRLFGFGCDNLRTGDVIAVLGGIGNIRGSVIAATLLYVLPEKLRFLQSYRMLIYAVVLIVVMLFSWSPKAREFRERYSLKRLIHKNTAKEAE